MPEAKNQFYEEISTGLMSLPVRRVEEVRRYLDCEGTLMSDIAQVYWGLDSYLKMKKNQPRVLNAVTNVIGGLLRASFDVYSALPAYFCTDRPCFDYQKSERIEIKHDFGIKRLGLIESSESYASSALALRELDWEKLKGEVPEEVIENLVVLQSRVCELSDLLLTTFRN